MAKKMGDKLFLHIKKIKGGEFELAGISEDKCMWFQLPDEYQNMKEHKMYFLLFFLPVGIIAEKVCDPVHDNVPNFDINQFLGKWSIHTEIGTGLLSALLVCPVLTFTDNQNGTYSCDVEGIMKGVKLFATLLMTQPSNGNMFITGVEPVVGRVNFYYRIHDIDYDRWQVSSCCIMTPLKNLYSYYLMVRNMSINLTSQELDRINGVFKSFGRSLNEPHTGCSLVPRVPRGVFYNLGKWTKKIFKAIF